jgi:large subunit ribosomal protein L6
MSRIGKQIIDVPSGVKVNVEKTRVVVEGPKGKLETPVPEGIRVEQSESTLEAKRDNDSKRLRSLHGLTRALLANAVNGVTQGFEKKLDVVGIGYRAERRGNYLNLSLGHSHPLELPVPEGVEIKVDRQQRAINNYVATITISGSDRYQVGQVAADIRALRPPDAYKGKGLRYSDEIVRTKVGKKGA